MGRIYHSANWHIIELASGPNKEKCCMISGKAHSIGTSHDCGHGRGSVG